MKIRTTAAGLLMTGIFLIVLASSGWAKKINILSIQILDSTNYIPLVGNLYNRDRTVSFDQVFVDNLNKPTHITNAGDGSNRLFVAEKSGKIRVIQNGVLLDEPYLDLTQVVDDIGERGLLSVAFPPDFSDTHCFYVYYTLNTGTENPGPIRISRFEVANSNDNQASGAEEVILEISHSRNNHLGGQLAFGPDEYLYISTGDGGSIGDPDHNAQSLDSLLGKILRIQVSCQGGYQIPSDNPFRNRPIGKEIWAYGLRNAWRFSFDRDNGNLWIGDVGQNAWEEVDLLTNSSGGGENFGWPCREGNHSYPSDDPVCDDPAVIADFSAPLLEYNHSVGRSITAGFVYRGQLYPHLTGRYIYADYIMGRIWSIYPLPQGGWSTPILEADTTLFYSTFGEDEHGELYLADYDGGTIRSLTSGPLP